MKKVLLIILIIIFAAAIMQGCKKQTDEIQTTQKPTPTQEEDTAPTQVEENTSEPVPADDSAIYVSLDGNDSNEGTVNEPFKTFAKAVEKVRAGQTVYIMEGVYTERLIINKSGTADAVITFMPYENDEVTIDGAGMSFETWGGLIKIDNQNHIRITGLNVINSPAMGIFACESGHITIDNNYVYNTFAPGIHCWGDNDLIIKNNTLEWTCNEENAPLECISTRRTTVFEISNNLIFNSGAIGICMGEAFEQGRVYNNEVYDTGLGIYVGGWDQTGKNTEVYNNICHHNKTGIAVNIENGGYTHDIKLYNNIVYENVNDGFNVGWGGVFEATHTVSDLIFDSNISYNNGGCGFMIMGVHNGSVDNVMLINNLSYNNNKTGIYINGVANAPRSYSIKNVSIINNTVVNNGNDEEWVSGGIFISNPQTSTSEMQNIIIQNNIVCRNKTFSIAVWKYGIQPENLIVKNNLIDGYMYDVNRYGETKGEDYVTGNPQFVDVENYDFHILEESPAVDAGSQDNAPQEDFDGIVRPQGDGVDIGAYEFK